MCLQIEKNFGALSRARNALFFSNYAILGFLDKSHRIFDEGDRLCRSTCFRGAVAERLAELACAGESGEQSVEVLHEYRHRAAFGRLLLHVGEVGLEQRLAGGGARLARDDVCRVVALGALVAKNALVGIAQEPRVFVGFAPDHHAVKIFQLLFHLVERLDAAVDADVQLGHFCLEAVHEVVMQRRDFSVFLGREALEPCLAGVNNEYAATGAFDSLYKIFEELPAVELVYPDTALDGDGDAYGILHGLEAVGHKALALHEACPEVPVLHAVRRTAAVEVHFLKTRGFHELACLREISRVAAPELQDCGVLEGFVPEELLRLRVEHRVRDDHLAVEQDVLGNQAQKVALVTVGAVEHRRNGKSAVEIQVHDGKFRKISRFSS